MQKDPDYLSDLAAIQTSLETVNAQPNNIDALLNTAKLLQERAELLLNEPSSDIDALIRYWKLFQQLGIENAALKCLDQALRIDDTNRDLWTIKYWTLVAANRLRDANAIPASKLLFLHTISVEAFCRTGEAGPIKLDMTRQQVRAFWGEPEGIIQHPDQIGDEISAELSPIWQYGPIEFYFNDDDQLLDRISFKQINNWRRIWSTSIRINPWVYKEILDQSGNLTATISKTKFEAALRKANINYMDLGQTTYSTHSEGTLLLESGVTAIYSDEGYETSITLLHRINQ